MALNLCDLWIPQPKYYAPEYFRQWVSLKNINFKETFFLFIFDNFWITEKLMLNLWRLNTPPKSFYFLWVQCRILVKNWEKNWLLQKEFYPIVYISLQTTWNILIWRWHLHWKIIWISKIKKIKNGSSYDANFVLESLWGNAIHYRPKIDWHKNGSRKTNQR